jgi:hypothetical protein
MTLPEPGRSVPFEAAQTLPSSVMTLESLVGRDGGTCVWCGREPWREDLTAEHLLPRAGHGHRMARILPWRAVRVIGAAGLGRWPHTCGRNSRPASIHGSTCCRARFSVSAALPRGAMRSTRAGSFTCWSALPITSARRARESRRLPACIVPAAVRLVLRSPAGGGPRVPAGVRRAPEAPGHRSRRPASALAAPAIPGCHRRSGTRSSARRSA